MKEYMIKTTNQTTGFCQSKLFSPEMFKVGDIVLFKITISSSIWYVGVIESLLTSTNGSAIAIVRQSDICGKVTNDDIYVFTQSDGDRIMPMNDRYLNYVHKKEHCPFFLTQSEIDNADKQLYGINTSASTKDISKPCECTTQYDNFVKKKLGELCDKMYDIEEVLIDIKGILKPKYYDDFWYKPMQPLQPWYNDKITCTDTNEDGIYNAKDVHITEWYNTNKNHTFSNTTNTMDDYDIMEKLNETDKLKDKKYKK